MSRKAPSGVDDLNMEEAAKAVKDGPEAMAKFVGKDNKRRAEEAAKRVRETGFDNKATEVRTDPTLRRIQDVAISTRIAIDRAGRALDYAEVALREIESTPLVKKAAKSTKRRVKDIEKAEAEIRKAMATLTQVRDDLDATLRRKA